MVRFSKIASAFRLGFAATWAGCAAALFGAVDYSNQDISDYDFTTGTLAELVLTSGSFHHLTAACATNFSARDLTGATFSAANLSGTIFEGARLTGVDFTGADITGYHDAATGITASTSFRGALGLTYAQIRSTASYQSKDLSNCAIEYQNVSGWDFSGFNLEGTHLSYSTFSAATNLAGAVLGTETAFFNVTDRGFTAEMLYATKNWQDKNLSGVSLGGNDLSGWDFSGQNLTGTRLHHATFAGTNFSGATFSNLIASNSSFVDAIIHDAKFVGSSPALTYAQIYTTADYKAGDLGAVGLYNTSFSQLDLSHIAMRDADFQKAVFRRCTLSGADLTGASLFKVHFYSGTTSMTSGGALAVTFSGATLSGTSFENVDLAGSDFTGAHLNGFFNDDGQPHTRDSDGYINADCYARTSFKNAKNLSLAQIYATQSYADKDLSYIDFEGFDFSGANLAGVDLTETKFTKGTISGAVLTGATLGVWTTFYDTAGLTAEMIYSTKSYADGEMSGVRFGKDNLEGWDFSGLNLQNTDWRSCTFSAATYFANSDLRGAFFNTTTYASQFDTTIGADGTLRNVSLTGADARLVVRPHATLSAVLPQSATVSGGATVAFKQGDNARIELSGSAVVLTFADDARVELHLAEGFLPAEDTVCALVSANGGRLALGDNFSRANIAVYNADGSDYTAGVWDLLADENGMGIQFSAVPEPAVCALLLGLGAMLCAARRRR